MASREFAKDNIKNLTVADLLDVMYGAIRSLVEAGKPDNIVVNYFMPPIPFGPELGAFMDIGPRASAVPGAEGSPSDQFTMPDLLRSAVCFGVMADYLPTQGGPAPSGAVIGLSGKDPGTVDLNALISSGTTISSIYDSVLRNCKVLNNSRSDEDEKVLAQLRSLLYEEPPQTDGAAPDVVPDAVAADDAELDLEALLGNGVDTGDIVENPDELAPPTRLMETYNALQTAFEQVEKAGLDELKTISPNDPNQGLRVRAIQQRRLAALRRWETQGKKNQVEAIMAKIAQLSQGGMPQYLDQLRRRFDGSEMLVSVFASELGASMLTERAWYTALRPNGILSAPTLMKIHLSSSNTEDWQRMTSSSTSGGMKLPIPGVSLLGNASGKRSSDRVEKEFLSEEFEISFEIVQGIIDRSSWLDLAFLESPAYTTVDPVSKEPLDQVRQIVALSDGKMPPESGQMRAIPTTAYFARNLELSSSAFSRVSEEEQREFSGKAGINFLGFGASAEHTSKTSEASWSEAKTDGRVTLTGQFMVAMASRFLAKAPNPDFGAHPDASDWI
jgi:hypothetical protein